MRTSRDQLKSVVKELLLEILNEGLGNVHQRTSQPPPASRAPISGAAADQRRRKPQYDARLDTPVGQGRLPSEALKEAVKRESGGSSVLASILADTAVTTLPTMLSHGDAGPSPSGPVQQEQFNGEVTEVFGEAAELRSDGSSHWADLAFMPSAKKSA